MVVPAFSGCQPFLTMSLYLDMVALLYLLPSRMLKGKDKNSRCSRRACDDAAERRGWRSAGSEWDGRGKTNKNRGKGRKESCARCSGRSCNPKRGDVEPENCSSVAQRR